MYKQIIDGISGKVVCIKRLTDNAFIPFDPANTDYQTFKRDIAEGVELQDAEGNVMSQDDVDAFLENLP